MSAGTSRHLIRISKAQALFVRELLEDDLEQTVLYGRERDIASSFLERLNSILEGWDTQDDDRGHSLREAELAVADLRQQVERLKSQVDYERGKVANRNAQIQDLLRRVAGHIAAEHAEVAP